MRIAFLGLRAIGEAESLGSAGSGIEEAVQHIASRLVTRGHDVTVFCRTHYNPSKQTNFRGVTLVNLPAIYTKHMEAISHTTLAAVHCMRGYDIAHFHATGPALLSFLPRLVGRQVAVTIHGLDWQREKWKTGAKLALRAGAWAAGRFPHKTIVVSRQLQRFYLEAYGRETVYVPNGVTARAPRPIDQLKRFGVAGNDYALFLGRIVPEKGCHFLIKAFRNVTTSCKLLIAGGASYSEDYLSELKSLAENDKRIVFTGPLYGKLKTEAYSNAICLVMPSTLEGMPLVMLEAMAQGCPVICSDIPEHLEIVDPEGAGGDAAPYAYTFASRSLDDLAEKLRICLATPGKREKKAEKARSYVLENFSWDRITDQTEALYRSLLSQETKNEEQRTKNRT